MGLDQVAEIAVLDLPVNIEREVASPLIAEEGGGLDEQVHSLVITPVEVRGGGHDPQGPIPLVELGTERGNRTGHPVGDDRDLPLEPDSAALDLVDQLLATGDDVSAELTLDLTRQGGNDLM